MEDEICVAVAGGGRYHVCEEQESRFADDCFEAFANKKRQVAKVLGGLVRVITGPNGLPPSLPFPPTQ